MSRSKLAAVWYCKSASADVSGPLTEAGADALRPEGGATVGNSGELFSLLESVAVVGSFPVPDDGVMVEDSFVIEGVSAS